VRSIHPLPRASSEAVISDRSVLKLEGRSEQWFKSIFNGTLDVDQGKDLLASGQWIDERINPALEVMQLFACPSAPLDRHVSRSCAFLRAGKRYVVL
jgi:hypothetical protein